MALKRWVAGVVLIGLVPCALAADDLFVQLRSTDNFESLSAPPAGWSASPMHALPASPVPEPEPYAMLLAGLCLMGTIVRQHRRILTHRVW
jgi:hypothetical protein